MLDKQDLIRERQHDLAILPEDEYQKIFIFFSSGKFVLEKENYIAFIYPISIFQ